jgi:L-fuculose-phosphate aldolase
MDAGELMRVKEEMCEIGRRIWTKGYCAGNEGNHSVRISENRVLCTPTGVSKGFLTPEMICEIDMEGKQVAGCAALAAGWKRTSEVLLHLQIYKSRPDVKAVIHSHPPHATAFACAGVAVPEGIHPEAEVFLGKVRTAAYTTPACKELGEGVVALIGPETNTVLMGSHGSVSFSTSLMDTYYKLEILDAYCRLLLLVKQVGRVNVLGQKEMVELLEVKEKFGFREPRLKNVVEIGGDNGGYLAGFEGDGAKAAAKANGSAKVRNGKGKDRGMASRVVRGITERRRRHA